MRNVIIGPPGTGKTYTLLNILEQKIKEGIHPNRICFVSFTRKAILEAKTRAMALLDVQELPYFKTLHALAFRQLGISREDILNSTHYKELSKIVGVNFAPPSFDEESGMLFSNNALISLENLARIKMMDYLDLYCDQNLDFSWSLFHYYTKIYNEYKRKNYLSDYTDLIIKFLKEGQSPDIDLLIVDEAQDLSPLQWAMIDKLSDLVSETYIAGDDDQAIYEWGGADRNRFIKEAESGEVLKKSFRIPEVVHKLSQRVIRSIRDRVTKAFSPMDYKGKLRRIISLRDIDLSRGQWLILCRNNYHIEAMAEEVQQQGFSYDAGKYTRSRRFITLAYRWEELRKMDPISQKKSEKKFRNYATKELDFNKPWFEMLDKIPSEETMYIRSLRKRGESPKNPRIKIATIHSVKGGECDNVILSLDMTRQTYNAYEEDSDPEHRVYYVGITRARKQLAILEPQTDKSFPI